MNRTALLFLILSSLTSSCMKYEDGPCISFRSQMDRLQGKWVLKYFTVDGNDSLQYWNEYFGNECTFTIQPYDDKITDHGPITIEWGDSLSAFYDVHTNYQGFSKDQLIIYGEVIQDPNSSAFPLAFLGTAELGGIYWTISRIKYDELWFQRSVNDKHYELHLENIKKF